MVVLAASTLTATEPVALTFRCLASCFPSKRGG